jgi:hypothetical protein
LLMTMWRWSMVLRAEAPQKMFEPYSLPGYKQLQSG